MINIDEVYDDEILNHRPNYVPSCLRDESQVDYYSLVTMKNLENP